MTSQQNSPRTSENHRPNLVVVGGGISGLAAAYRLKELMPESQIDLLETSGRLGGVLHTVKKQNFLIEESADNFITTLPSVTELCKRLGMSNSLLNTNEKYRRAMVVCRGQLQPIPQGFMIMAPKQVGPMLTTPILSLRGKLRMLAEYFVKQKSELTDESLADFATRRFGKEVFERLIQPLVGGIYTADPQKLSLQATLPRFMELEQVYGSLIRGALKEEKEKNKTSGSAVRYSLFTAPQEGMSSLVNKIGEQFSEGEIHFNSPVESIRRNTTGKWILTIDGENPREINADGVIIATPAFVSGRILKDFSLSLSEELSCIPYAGCAVVSLGFDLHQLERPLDSFGFVVPQIEQRKIISASFSSMKYSGRAPDGSALIRVFIGGACQAELIDLPDEQLIETAREELRQLLGIRGKPVMSHLRRYHESMPQYHVGHSTRVNRIEELVSEIPQLQIAGNAFRGVGIPQCISSGERAAEQIAAEFLK